MEEILTSLGLQEHLAHFEANKVGPEEALSLNDEEYRVLGIPLMGDRARIRNRCREFINGPKQSVLQRFLTLQQNRRGANARTMPTRRIRVGWKHSGEGLTRLISETKGGGKQVLDVNKSFTLEQLTEEVKELYFPRGKSQLMAIDGLEYNLEFFNGMRVSDKWMESETLEVYLKRETTHPIRFYLHTEANSLQPSETSETVESGNTHDLQTEVRIRRGRSRTRGIGRASSTTTTNSSSDTAGVISLDAYVGDDAVEDADINLPVMANSLQPSETSETVESRNTQDLQTEVRIQRGRPRTRGTDRASSTTTTDSSSDTAGVISLDAHVGDDAVEDADVNVPVMANSLQPSETSETVESRNTQDLQTEVRIQRGRPRTRGTDRASSTTTTDSSSDTAGVISLDAHFGDDAVEDADVNLPVMANSLQPSETSETVESGNTHDLQTEVRIRRGRSRTRGTGRASSTTTTDSSSDTAGVISLDTRNTRSRSRGRRLSMRRTTRGAATDDNSGEFDADQSITGSQHHLDVPGDEVIPTDTGTPTVSFMARERQIIFHDPVMDVDEDEDDLPDLLLTEDNDTSPPFEQLTLQGRLQVWALAMVNPDKVQSILIQRERVLATALRATTKPSFDFLADVEVEFSNEEVGSELAADFGGPRREFFGELMKEILSNCFEGEAGHMAFSHNINALDASSYEQAGKLVAWSLLHGGPGIPCMGRTSYALMVERESWDVNLEDIPDYGVRQTLHRILNCETTDDLRRCCSEISGWLIDMGYCKPTTSLEILHQNDFIRSLVKTHLFYRVHAETHQFVSGLRMFGFWDMVMSSPGTFEPLFVDAGGPLTFRQLKDLYRVELSPRGSNKRQEENDTMFGWEDFLRSCDRGDMEISIIDVLQFWTGSSRIPPLGFDRKLSIEFVPKRDPPPLPVAHTCGLVLELMRGYDPDALAANMTYAIKHCGGFFLA